MGNSHLPIGKIASVTTPIVFVIFGFYRSFAFPVNFSSMASGNFVIFVGFVIFAFSSRAFYYLICIFLLLFVNGPTKFCNFRYFRSFRNT